MSEDKINPELQAEIEAALGSASLENLLDENPEQRKRGEARAIKTGVVAAIHGSNVLIEFGPRMQGSCPKLQFETLPNVGDSLEFVIERKDKDGMLVLSRQGAIQKATWDALEIGQIVEAMCTGTNKGGLEMELANHKAFMPAGQVELYHVADLTIFSDRSLPAKLSSLIENKTESSLVEKQCSKQNEKKSR